MRIGDHRYIDGGAWSSTNVDLLAGLGLDEVYVLAPQVSFDADRPSQLSHPAGAAVAGPGHGPALPARGRQGAPDGTEVTVLGPGADDLEAIGGNLMEVGRRRQVLETSLRTSAAALHDPAPLTTPTHFKDAG